MQLDGDEIEVLSCDVSRMPFDLILSAIFPNLVTGPATNFLLGWNLYEQIRLISKALRFFGNPYGLSL